MTDPSALALDAPGARTAGDRWFFPALAVLISGTGFAGFSFTYFGPILGGTYPPAGAPLHLHGWSFFLWYLLFPLQAVLIGTGRGALHRALGRSSVVLVAVMALTGLLVLSVRVEEALRTGGPEVWLQYGPHILSNLVLFVAFYAAALRMALTARFAAHMRLMVVASAIGLGAGFARLILYLSGFHPLWLPMGTLGCSLFIGLGIVYDALTRRHVHSAYWIGLAALLVVEGSMLPQVNPDGVAWVNEGLGRLGEFLGVVYQPEPTVEF
ncbi:hypothetical protein [Rubrivirga marina]|uniref:Uncharacterized protein n=1 Tax=Rubrivirga marina TaxID=1196024 RepID=A0A271J3E7_9BACT|nr:hypothetical protein [Rubrivirga marina]PAP77229.1 hypothetical protein BSZ37_12690 [Rubrivirga marina]